MCTSCTFPLASPLPEKKTTTTHHMYTSIPLEFMRNTNIWKKHGILYTHKDLIFVSQYRKTRLKIPLYSVFLKTLADWSSELCTRLRWSIISSYHSPQFKYMNFHIFTCILYHLATGVLRTRSSRNGLLTSTQSGQLPVGLIAQLVVHRYRRGHEFESRWGL